MTTAEFLSEISALTARYPWMTGEGFMTLHLSDYGSDIRWFVDSRQQVAAIIREVRGRWIKNSPADSDYDSKYATWRQTRDRITYLIVVDRDQVCTRVEVGRHTETVEVPVTTRTETVEVVDYEWRCTPVLGVSA